MQGVVEFETDSGAQFRYMRESRGIWSRYCKRGDSYVYDGRVAISGRATPRKLWDARLHQTRRKLFKCKSETCGECVFLPPTGEDGECRMCSERNLWRRVDEPASDAGDEDPHGLICPLYEPRKTEPDI
jgi:predicted sulfurtransferase